MTKKYILFVTTALVKKFVLTSNCPDSEGPLQSECSDWSPMALSLHRVSLQRELTVPDWRLRRLILLLSLLKAFLSIVPLLPACLHLGKLPVVDDPGQLALHQSHLRSCSFKSRTTFEGNVLAICHWAAEQIGIKRDKRVCGMEGSTEQPSCEQLTLSPVSC